MTWDQSENALNFADNVYAHFGTGDDLKIYHDGTDSIIGNSTGTLQILSPNQMRFRAGNFQFVSYANDETMATFTDDGSVALYYDNSKKFETTSAGTKNTGVLDCTGSILLADQSGDNIGKIRLGDAQDFEIYHDGSNSIINDAGTGLLQFQSGGSTKAAIVGDGVQLYEHLYVQDTDRIKIGDGSDLQIYHDGSKNYLKSAAFTNTEIWSDTFFVKSVTGAGEAIIKGSANGAVELYYDNNKKFETTSYGTLAAGLLSGDTLHMTGASNSAAMEINPGSNAGSIVLDRNGHITSLIRASDGGSNVAGSSGGGSRITLGKTQMHFKTFPYTSNIGDTPTYTTRASIDTSGNFVPGANNSYNLGTSSLRWANVYTNDLHLSNEGHSNEVDGTWGNWTIQEGESDLFLKNNRSGKKYKFNLTEVS
jgi:hypothetical protein